MSIKLLNTLAAATTITGVVTMAGIANAASLVQTASTTLTPTNIVNDTLTINQFDPSLGTLQSVSVEFTGNIEGNATFINTATSEEQAEVSLNGETGLTVNNQSLLSLTPEYSSIFTIAAGEREEEQLVATQTREKTITDSELLQAFTGNETLDFGFSATAKSVVSGSGNLFFNVRTQANAAIKVTYNYGDSQDVPEPSSILGFGLIAGVGMVSLRKKNWLQMSKV